MTDRILTFDIATVTGWAFYIPKEMTVAEIECDTIEFEGDNAFQKVRAVRDSDVPMLIRTKRPTIVILEAPLTFIPTFVKKGKADIFGAQAEETRTMNPTTIMQLNRLHGAIQAIVEAFRVPCEEVQPKTWQTIIPKTIKGKPKQRVSQYCDMLRIIGKDDNARDAAIMAIWAAGRSQVLKLSQQAQEKLL